jgi:vacuolar-type H+-ATPase subunit C/Vma6
VSPRWEDLNARVRGLATHLAPRDALEELAGAPDLATLARGCVTLGVISDEPEEATPIALELAFRRGAARNLLLLERWLGPREPLLRIVFEDEDRRSLRALIRGAAAGVASELRLAGLIPTSSLPERQLEELARQSRVRDLAALLVVWQHPYGSPLLAAAGGATPDLFKVECALNQTFARRAAEGSRHGGRELFAWVEETIDLENLKGALVLASGDQEQPPELAFLPGGRRIPLERFRVAALTRDPVRTAALLAGCFGAKIARLLQRHATAPAALENALLAHRLLKLQSRARHDPLGPAPVLWYLLRLRAQALRLRLLLWSTAIGLPPALRRDRLAEVA